MINIKKKFEKRINKLISQNKIVPTGFIEDTKLTSELLSICDICLLPFKSGIKSRYSSFLATYNQKIKMVTTTDIPRTYENGIYYAKINSKKDLLEKNYCIKR